MGSGVIRTGMAGDWVVFHLEGELRCVCGFTFSNFVDQVFEEGRPSGAIIDLRNSVYIDSTNLGILARIARKSHSAGIGPPFIISTSDEIDRVLGSMGFHKVFRMIREWPGDIIPDPILCTELDKCETDTKNQARCFLAAHEDLVEIDPENEAKFSDVIKFLKKETGEE